MVSFVRNRASGIVSTKIVNTKSSQDPLGSALMEGGLGQETLKAWFGDCEATTTTATTTTTTNNNNNDNTDTDTNT